MSKKLVQVAAEINVGTKTIVEYLRENGYEIEDRPTAKVTDEMYDILVVNFQNTLILKNRLNN
jgi:translation initiation factor IF-2